MTHPNVTLSPVTRGALLVAPRLWAVVVAVVMFGAAAVMVPDPVARLVLAGVGGTLACLALMIRALVIWYQHRQARFEERIADFVAHDAAPSFTTDSDGQISYRNRAAQERFGAQGALTLVRTLGDLFANPSAVLYRLQTRAAAAGAAREDLVTRRGHVRLAVHRIGESAFLWRLEEMMERQTGGRGADAHSLPMLTISDGGTILFMNEAMRRLIGGRVRTLDRIFTDLPVRSGEEMTISAHDGPVRALVVEVKGSGRRSEIYLLPASDVIRPAEEATDFETLPVALLRLAADGAVLAANRSARDLLEHSGDDNARLSDLVEGLGRPVDDWLMDAMVGRTLNRPEVLRATRPESEVYVQISLRRVVEHGRPGLIAVLNDATEFKTLEAQFVQSQKMQAIGQLAGGVAHDFNNLLTAISGHCDLLLLRHGTGDQDYADLVQIHQNANRAASLVRQLLAFSRKQTLMPQTLDLRDTLSDLTHLLNRLVGEQVTLTLSHASDLGMIRADKRQLEQVIMNLVVNGRDAMPDGGSIVIETENLTLAEDMQRERATVPAGDYVIVRVTDKGTGIPPERMEKIFEPFFTTKRTGEGTGLGLSTAYGIIKQTGGFIFADSEPGKGSTFSLYFPVTSGVAETAQILAKGDAIGPTEPNGGVILLVEDEAPVRAFASRALRLRGFTVLEAENAEQALKTLEDPDLNVDVFVTDVIMPGMDGPSWVREAQRQRPDTRVIFTSGYAEDSFSAARARITNSVFLPKPFSLTELTATVQEQLH
ncbi:two-component system cell cycle sensor histidine kinase/response regulator CckA [Rhodobacteraceae bacterium MBR-64]